MSLPPLTVCFIWHMHQPDYKDHLTGQYMMPWVRLHALKDYLDMVTLLEGFPNIRQTFNLVPSLIAQLQDYSQPGIWDQHQQVTLQERLSEADQRFILERFFDAHPRHMIGRLPSYRALWERKQQFGSTDEALPHFSEQELFDITALFHLAWLDPQWIEKSPEFKALINQGQGYSLTDRHRILELQRQLIAETLPTYRRFQEAGQIEITTTPYYHPILPLLMDTEIAKICQPERILPQQRFHFPEDAQAHIQKAIECYTDVFGCRPRGVWPAEQSISEDALRFLSDSQFQWAVSNDGNLGNSLGIHWNRDEYGHYQNIEHLARPYAFAGLNLLFRHLTLSDLIGFHYASLDPEAAAADCYHRIKQIQYQMAAHQETIPFPVLTIALDGENCWESYPMDGVPFLKALYQKLSGDTSLNVSRVEDYFEGIRHQANTIKALPKIHPGSWIDSNFHIWIGDPIKNMAWDLLSNTRKALVTLSKAHTYTPEVLEKAWHEIYIAEGSDWFWWYGDPHNSGQDHLFDFQFRLHLQNVYTLLGEDPPEELHIPLSPLTSGRTTLTPSGPIHPTIEGQLTHPQEWQGAGVFDLSLGEGAMHRGDRLLTHVHYGYDQDWLYLRFDLQRELLKPTHQLALYFCNSGKTRYNSPIRLKVRPHLVQPSEKYLYAFELQLKDLAKQPIRIQTAEAMSDYLWRDRPDIPVEAAYEDLVEVAIPFNALNTQPGDWLHMAVALAEKNVVIDFIPHQGLLAVQRPPLLEAPHARESLKTEAERL